MRVSTSLSWRQKKSIALLAASTRNSTDVNLQEPTGMGLPSEMAGICSEIGGVSWATNPWIVVV